MRQEKSRGIAWRLWNYARNAWWFWTTPEPYRPHFEFYIAGCLLRDWWDDWVYHRDRCCATGHVLGIRFGHHCEDCDDLPF